MAAIEAWMETGPFQDVNLMEQLESANHKIKPEAVPLKCFKACAETGHFQHAELVEQLSHPRQQRVLREMMRAFEGPEQSEDEDGRGLYHDTRCLLRYLRARSWDLKEAEAMLRETGRWRKSFDFAGLVEGMYADTVFRQNSSGKMYVRGFDRRGRPIVYMKARNELVEDSQSIIRHLVYNLERAARCIDRRADEGNLFCPLTDPDSGQLVALLDFADVSVSNLVPISVAGEVVTILQNHYPERLGQAFLLNLPWVLSAFISAVWQFLDPVTQNKVQCISEEGEERSARLAKHFDLESLEPEFGGAAVEPFQSHIFLGRKRGDSEFGMEFDEQVALCEEETQEAREELRREELRRSSGGSATAPLLPKQRSSCHDDGCCGGIRTWLRRRANAARNPAAR
mmetsp:Transcript_59397/g.159050  ORF Transcript_59397/g.159050 Transcript_59397/m.159050 type:complete len:399 (-) Transcript_59397:59-1255(-)|eukprot:CAMPEP_0171198814 /NCGR_PEP_ID=MMETSP0790-20130122/23141_1 /TAXON_ID=2925 /ORGANISM="Alexandrium catenella, Strain OF101" /LENGTH=398 /DNA_ID=CAMNT_0011664139 /DNA_START=49 /DNA_END=1245 /DNA_ORIENTATION=-